MDFVNPAAVDDCNGKDDDCNGRVDDGAEARCPRTPECSKPACRAGACRPDNEAPGTACSNGVCDGSGQCIPPLTLESGSVPYRVKVAPGYRVEIKVFIGSLNPTTTQVSGIGYVGCTATGSGSTSYECPRVEATTLPRTLTVDGTTTIRCSSSSENGNFITLRFEDGTDADCRNPVVELRASK
jgi:hypothetical protein